MANPSTPNKLETVQSQGLDKEIKAALNAALEANIIKEDSTLSVYLANNWAA